MAFQISAETADDLTLTPATANVGCLRGFIGSFGLLGLVVGGGLLWLRSAVGADPVNLAAGAFLVMGLGFVVLSLFASFNPSTGIAAFVFDRHLGAVRVRSDSAPFGPPTEAYLAYANITGLDVETRSQSGSGGSNRSSRTTYTYHVVLRLRDGASWLLTSDSTRDAADAQRLRLATALVPRPDAGPDLVVPAPELPPQVKRSTRGGATSLRWHNPVTRQEVGGKLALLGGFGGVLGLFFTIIHSQQVPWFAYGVLGFIALMFALIAVTQIRRLRQDATHSYGLEFGPEAVAYFEEVLTTGQETHRERVARADWYGLSYSFDATAGENEAVLLLTIAAHVQYLEQQQVGSLGKGLSLLLEKNQSRTLRFKNFSPVQRLAVVNWVQAEVGGWGC
ncbi:MAG: hypothetical protein M3Y54_10835 [Bacteroidota bacterium]|nr:hypothetical protein [Bacteroidota bacterium]